MINQVRQLIDLAEILCSKDGRSYLRLARRPSFGAYRICRGLKIHCGELASIVDVGANRGQFAMASRHFFPNAKLYCFEPIPSHANALGKRFSRISGVHVENKAVGAAEGTARFHISEYDHLSSFAEPTERRLAESPDARIRQSIEVDVVTLDQWFANRAISGTTLLKLDVQGFENEVLAGASELLKRVDYLLYESSFERMYHGEKIFSEMFDHVRGLGFELVAPLEFWTGPSHRVCEVDLLWRRAQ